MRAVTTAVLIASMCGCATSDRADVTTARDVGLALRAAFDARTPDFDRACARTLAWLDARSGDPGVAERRAAISRMRMLMARSPDADAFAEAVTAEFMIESVSPDPVHFTAYFAPEFGARHAPDVVHDTPLHARPEALPPGNPDEIPWHARARIADGDLLADRVLAWLEPMDAYLAQVNGSVRLRFDDGSTLALSHDGTNGLPYRSLGRLMVDARLLPVGDVTMQSIREAYALRPDDVRALMRSNERYVFFRAVDAAAFPRSGLGVALLPETAVATDKSVFPGGDLMLVRTVVPDASGRPRPYARLVLDLDRGGAIRGAARADLYLGVGAVAGARAGATNASGRLYVVRAR